LFGALPWGLKRLCWTTSLADGIYIGTGVAVLWYTVEAFYLRRETVRQNEIAIQPLVVVYLEAAQLKIKNVGMGSALFIRIQPMTLIDPAGDKVPFTAKFDALSNLAPGESFILGVRSTPMTDGVNPAHLDPIASLRTPVKAYRMTVEYQDVRGRPHVSEMQIDEHGIGLCPFGPAALVPVPE